MLRQLGMEVDFCRMEFGDVAWLGIGANSLPVSVGIEAKTLDDVLACIISGRFAGHQLPGLINSYDHIWLLVCGEYGPRSNDGVLMHRKHGQRGDYWTEAGGGQRRWMARDLEAWFMTMQIMGGLRVQRCLDWREGCQWIKTAYNWFQQPDHKSHLVMHCTKELYQDQALLQKPSLARRVAKELPGVGLVRSADVAQRFPNLEQMVMATPKQWMEIDGIGPGIASKVYEAIHGKNGNRR